MSFRFKLDENLPRDAEALLHGVGFDVETALSENLGGAEDPTILRACRDEGRVLITLDLDFADIRAYPPGENHGIWVLRPGQQTVSATLTLMRAALKLLATETPNGRLWVVEADRIRIRE